jgi:alpha-N-acetylglucosaminidase
VRAQVLNHVDRDTTTRIPPCRPSFSQSWGGPLDSYWISAQRELQVAALGRMQDWGMTPVLPGFAGHVPPAFVTKYPQANVTRSSEWGNFNATCESVIGSLQPSPSGVDVVRPVLPRGPHAADGEVWLLSPTDPMFSQIGSGFITAYRGMYKTPAGGWYNMDVFNEVNDRFVLGGMRRRRKGRAPSSFSCPLL